MDYYSSYLQFRDCVRRPDLWLRTLTDISFDEESLACSKYFAECKAIIAGKPCMVYAPISQGSTRIAVDSINTLSSSGNAISSIAHYADEHLTNAHYDAYASIFVEEIPEGVLLAEALYTHTRRNLERGLREFRKLLRTHDISLGNITTTNIIVDSDNRWHPIRCLYAQQGRTRDAKALRAIANEIKECGIDEGSHTTTEQAPSSSADYPGKLFPLCERRRRVITKDGVGFVNENNVCVLPHKYLSATDFYENRSIVTTIEGRVGIIDRYGKYIIPAEFDRIDFDKINGDSKAYRGDEVTIFDYLGNRI